MNSPEHHTNKHGPESGPVIEHDPRFDESTVDALKGPAMLEDEQGQRTRVQIKGYFGSFENRHYLEVDRHGQEETMPIALDQIVFSRDRERSIREAGVSVPGLLAESKYLDDTVFADRLDDPAVRAKQELYRSVPKSVQKGIAEQAEREAAERFAREHDAYEAALLKATDRKLVELREAINQAEAHGGKWTKAAKEQFELPAWYEAPTAVEIEAARAAAGLPAESGERAGSHDGETIEMDAVPPATESDKHQPDWVFYTPPKAPDLGDEFFDQPGVRGHEIRRRIADRTIELKWRQALDAVRQRQDAARQHGVEWSPAEVRDEQTKAVRNLDHPTEEDLEAARKDLHRESETFSESPLPDNLKRLLRERRQEIITDLANRYAEGKAIGGADFEQADEYFRHVVRTGRIAGRANPKLDRSYQEYLTDSIVPRAKKLVKTWPRRIALGAAVLFVPGVAVPALAAYAAIEAGGFGLFAARKASAERTQHRLIRRRLLERRA